MLEGVTMPVNLEAFFESIDKCGASDELKAAMKDSFNVLHESALEEGLGYLYLLPLLWEQMQTSLATRTKNPECKSIRNFYFLPLHSSLFTKNAF